MQQDEITQLQQQQQSSLMTKQLSATNLIQERMLMAEQAQTQTLSTQLNDVEMIRKAEARAAEAENENLVQQLFDISNRVKKLNKILAEKDAAVDQLRREHDTAESKKAEENDEL